MERDGMEVVVMDGDVGGVGGDGTNNRSEIGGA